MISHEFRGETKYSSKSHCIVKFNPVEVLQLTSRMEKRLRDLASEEFRQLEKWLISIQIPREALLIEVCRVSDYWNVRKFLLGEDKFGLSRPQFDVLMRGWSPALGLLLPEVGRAPGFLLMESNEQTFGVAMKFLDSLGKVVSLRRSADMLHHGIAVDLSLNDEISIGMSEPAKNNHYSDRIDSLRLQDLESEFSVSSPLDDLIESVRVEDLKASMSPLVFPWETSRGTLIGYDSEPKLDDYFLAQAAKAADIWRKDAGISPNSVIGNISSTDLISVVLLLASFSLKHIYFIGVGRQVIPQANYNMSLTIWKPRSELEGSIVEFTGMDPEIVSAAFDLIIVGQSQHKHFQNDYSPYVPLLIEASGGYLAIPLSGLFKNPLRGILELHPDKVANGRQSIGSSRESWMISELYSLFLGDRYVCVDGQTNLKYHGRTLTDIDAAVLDRATGELGLFQLKWQDFSSDKVKTQRSKAKNFVNQVGSWAEKLEMWIEEYGLDGLCRSLRIPKEKSVGGLKVRLFAIGRVAARFGSYGFQQGKSNIAVCSWDQFVRIRYELGTTDLIFCELFELIVKEIEGADKLKPLPHEIVVGDQTIRFEDFWVGLEE